MASCSPNLAEIRHLVSVLDAYDRDELWLRVKHIYDLPMQATQFTADVIDVSGDVLRDTSGLQRSHTFQLSSSSLQIETGQRVRLARDGEGVVVNVLPLRQLVSSPARSSDSSMTQADAEGTG
jgi:hypothetical protein